MNTLTREELQRIGRSDGGLCVSLYLPTETAGKETLTNPTRLRHLLRHARQRLIEAKVDAREADRVLRPAEDLVADYPFWQHQEAGLGLLLGPGGMTAYKIPYPVQELAVVGRRYHLKPLLPLVAYDAELLILTLSKKAVRLHRATRYTIEEIPLEGVPLSQEEALQLDKDEEILRIHKHNPGSNAGRGENKGIVHGQGAAREGAKERALRFFQRVDAGLKPYLNGRNVPMVLAAVDYYLPIFREATSYRHVLDSVIPGNAEGMHPGELRDAAWKCVEPALIRELDATHEQVRAGLPKNLAHTDLESCVAAACHGRVDRCIVALNEQRWGRFIEDSAKIELLPPGHPDSCDLVDLVAIQTLVQGGNVYPVPSAESLPDKSPVAVVLRY